MRTISVIYAHDFCQDSDVNVIVDGQCRHNRIEFDTDSNGEQTIVCQRCDAWKYLHNELEPNRWYSEIILEVA